jgi:hypothetical protein
MTNIFQRYAYSPSLNYKKVEGIEQSEGNNMVVFSGGDMQAYINNIKVGNLESVTWSISVEVVGNYVMGKRDAVIYTTGKRVVVGSMVLSQYDRHALLEQVFRVRKNNINTVASLWSMDVNNRIQVGQGNEGTNLTASQLAAQNARWQAINIDNSPNSAEGDYGNMRGISRGTFEVELDRMKLDAARTAGAQKIKYSDQLPAFDLTLVGFTKGGEGARCSIFGLQVTQETAGFSQNDLGNSVGMSFVALAVDPWQSIDGSALDITTKSTSYQMT